MKIYVCNAFSLSMLDREAQSLAARGLPAPQSFPRTPYPVDNPVEWLSSMDVDCNVCGREFEVISAIGHADTARVLSGLLGRDLPANRITVRLGPGVYVLIGQLMDADGGPLRLPEGATTLPEGARIEWWAV